MIWVEHRVPMPHNYVHDRSQAPKVKKLQLSASGRRTRPAWTFHATLTRVAWDQKIRRVIEEARGPPQLMFKPYAGRVRLYFLNFSNLL